MIFHDADARLRTVLVQAKDTVLLGLVVIASFQKGNIPRTNLPLRKKQVGGARARVVDGEPSYLCTYPVQGNPYNDDARARGVTVALIRIDEIGDRFPASG